MSYFRSINQAVVVSSENTDTSNLPVNGIYTGTGISTLGINAIQVNLKADQNCTVYVDQGPDVTTFNLTDSFNYYNGLGGNAWTTQATDAYTRVRVKNVGTASTTSKILSTVLCPIVEALPRALSAEGNLKVGVYEIEGDFGTRALVSPMHALKETQSLRLVGVSFTGDTTDTNFWVFTGTGTGAGTQTGGQLTLATGVTASSTIRIQSNRVARYISANTNYYRGQVQCPTQVGACTRRWGAFDTVNGYFFQYDGTNISMMSRKTTDSTVANGAFNGQYGLSYILDNSCNTYEIYWTNRKAYYFINDNLLHTLSSPMTTAVGTPSLPVSLECNNGTGNTNNNTLVARSSTINRLGQANTRPIFKYFHGITAATVLKYGPGTLQKVVINSYVSGSTISIYDALSATNPIALIVPAVGSQPNTPAVTIPYDLDFYTGLTIVIANAATDVTFIYE